MTMQHNVQETGALEAFGATVDLNDFVDEFGEGLLASLNQTHPPVYDGEGNVARQSVMDSLARQPFPEQADVVQAISALMLDRNEPAGIINAEMGTGKTMMAIAAAAVFHNEGYQRFMVIAPPHLVYKWRREILETMQARVWVLNGPDTLAKLLSLRESLGESNDGRPEFFIVGRVRMRMGYHWRPVASAKRVRTGDQATCPDCGSAVLDNDGEPLSMQQFLREEKRRKCQQCQAPLWTLMRPQRAKHNTQRELVLKALCKLPTIGKVSAERLVSQFGEAFLASMLGDNIHEFINLMDDDGDLVFSDKQAVRIERAMANIEFGFGEGGYQASEFIKRVRREVA